MSRTNPEKQYDHFGKVLMIGNSGVGKTNILLRYSNKKFDSNHLATVGVDFKVELIKIDNKVIRLQIWDTAGQQKFKTITKSYYNGCTGIFIVYAINDRKSFNAVEHWISQAKQNTDRDTTMILIGNKVDIEKGMNSSMNGLQECSQREVRKEQGQQLAQKYNMDFFEVSAKAGINITQMFIQMAKQIKQKVFQSEKTFDNIFSNGSKVHGKPSLTVIPDDREDKEGKKNKNKKCC